MRFGLLGTGPWADRTHGPALVAHPDVELVGVWGRRAEAASAQAERLGTEAYSGVDALFAACDAVAIALPPDVQAPLAVRAAEAGCHLLLDKPLATTPEAARAVTHAADRAGVATVVFFTLHFSGTTANWMNSQAQKGGWRLGRADWLSPVFGGGDSPYTASPWRREKGALWDVGPHALSVLLPLLGTATEITAVPGGSGDTVHLVLRHESGGSSTCVLSHSVPPAAAGVTAEVRGPAGAAQLPDREEPPEEAFGVAIDALLAAVRSGVPHPCDAHFAATVTDLLHEAEAQLPTEDQQIQESPEAPGSP
ncbi:Gfo/Idh/MocA family protein [Streptomyces iconiensis]|uniref:Gfo/Idh/MocA family oxidoreductase n=1 Tax=Streptomyces iconiensis TaxID=1384038 RepID=A0ABT7AA11_9ACTN|nr:Gfo/Idh/MocA family oxidoreductase [Streptomyces iconiensis]MDJ1137443.1 Gfo/Idh/MocA family oxidoreductase [Streptomyces iconiensis]